MSENNCDCAANRDVEFLNKVYQNAQMGSDSIQILCDKIEEAPLLADLRTQHEQYTSITAQATAELANLQSLPKEKGPMAQVGLWTGVQMNTVADKTPDHIAEMMIQGSMMGVIDMSRCLKRYTDACQQARNLGEQLIEIEENNIQRMKQYLS